MLGGGSSDDADSRLMMIMLMNIMVMREAKDDIDDYEDEWLFICKRGKVVLPNDDGGHGPDYGCGGDGGGGRGDDGGRGFADNDDGGGYSNGKEALEAKCNFEYGQHLVSKPDQLR